jgi:hypothetical protein
MPLGRRPDPNRCPDCRERVTPFAAGCALCGADLDPLRHRPGPSRPQRAGSAARAFTMGPRVRPRGTRWGMDSAAAAVFALFFSCAIVSAALGAAFYVVSLLL